MESKMEINVRLRYEDRKGNVWKIFEKKPFGKALLVREDRPGTSVEMRFVDIRHNVKIAS